MEIHTLFLLSRGELAKTKDLFIHHFTAYNGDEVDLVLEDRAGRIVGIEIKASATIDTSHFKGLKALAQAAGDRFVRGIVIYSGNTSVPFGSNLLAHPATEIWA